MAAQNVQIAGAQYNGVPSITLNKVGGGTASFIDTSDADAVAGDIAAGKIAYVDGEKVVGTGSGGGETGDVIYASFQQGTPGTTSSLRATGIQVTCQKAGTYKVRTLAFSTYPSISITSRAQVRFYKNNSAVGSTATLSAQTETIVEEVLTLDAGDVIKVYAKSANSTYEVLCSGCFICPNE